MSSTISSKMPLLEIRTAVGNKFIQTSEILYLQAINKHSLIFFHDLSKVETTRPLKWYQEHLPEPIFFRCHDSFIVNCIYLNFISSCQLILINNVRISLSRYKKEECKKNLENLHCITCLTK